MSVARVTYVKKSRKPYVCGKCRDEIPTGSAYRWFQVGFRSRYYQYRCMKSECTPRTSELESSKMADVYSAQEGFEDSLDALQIGEDASEIESLLSDFADSVRDTANEYREADEQFGGGGMTDSGEKADGLESAADEIESFSPSVSMDDVEPCAMHTDEETAIEDDPDFEKGDDLDAVVAACDDCAEKRSDAWVELIDEARQHVGDIDWGF